MVELKYGKMIEACKSFVWCMTPRHVKLLVPGILHTLCDYLVNSISGKLKLQMIHNRYDFK